MTEEKKIYDILRNAEGKSMFDEYGYAEYCYGLLSFNDIAQAYIELYEKSIKETPK